MMKTTIPSLLLALLLIGSIKAMSQSDISQVTSWYNRANFNPATITRDDYLYLFTNIRQQWTGVKGAPTTINVQGSEYFKNKNSALGFSLTADLIGITQSVNPMASYAYRIDFKKHEWLSMGISAGVFSRTFNTAQYEAENINDPSINYNFEPLLRPDVNIGFEYRTEHFIYALSSTHLLSIAKSEGLFLNSNHRYLSFIYKNDDPVLYNYNVGIQLINRQNLLLAEASVCLRIKHQTGLLSGPREIFEIGATYRSSHQLTLLAGINLRPDIKLGYAYIQSFINSYYPNGSHEIVFEYRIPKKAAFSGQYRDRGFWYR